MKTAKKFNPFKAPVSFLFWFNGKANKVSLASGQKAFFHDYHTTDEGWSSTDMLLRRKGNLIILDQYHDGRDCDGRMSSGGRSICHISDRTAHKPFVWGERPKRERFPVWSDADHWQRDYEAEKAGY